MSASSDIHPLSFLKEHTKKTTVNGQQSNLPILQSWYPSFEDGFLIWHGIVLGHSKLPDHSRIHTSIVRKIVVMPRKPGQNSLFKLYTLNTCYTCYLDDASPRCKLFFEIYQRSVDFQSVPGFEVLKQAMFPHKDATEQEKM